MTSSPTAPAAAAPTRTADPCQCPRCRRAARRADQPRRAVETADYAAMMGRMTKAYAARVGNGDAADLPLLAKARADMDAAIAAAVVSNVVDHGYSWADIGRELGITRQAAFQRFGKLIPADAVRRTR
jgi:hypothetical protein